MTNEVVKWLEALPEKTIEEELAQLRAERQALDQKIEVREQALAVVRSFASENGSEPAQAPDQFGSLAVTVTPTFPFRGREAIRRVIAATPEQETWTIPEMLQAILARGWEANTHTVQVNLSRMYRDGELAKAGTGIYCRPNSSANLLASAQEAQE